MNPGQNPFDFYLGLKTYPALAELNNLVAYLERTCFAQVGVEPWTRTESYCGLVLNLESGLALEDALYHYKKGDWGNITRPERIPCCHSDWHHLFTFLEAENNIEIDIEECNIQFADVRLTLQRTRPKSIIEDWARIFDLLTDHYKDFSHNGSQKPQELYLTVYNEAEPNKDHEQYDTFWALYFEDGVDSLIYDVRKRLLCTEDVLLIKKGSAP